MKIDCYGKNNFEKVQKLKKIKLPNYQLISDIFEFIGADIKSLQQYLKDSFKDFLKILAISRIKTILK